jgi:putative peptidoglycan lipid II flippase
MVASSLITVASLPVYAALFHTLSTVGLAIASDIGIVANTVALAVMLHRRRLVPCEELQWGELGKAFVVTVVSGVLSYEVARVVMVNGSRMADIKALGLVTVTWAAAVAAGLWLTRSRLVADLRRRKQTPYPRVAEAGRELNSGIEP